VQAGALNTLIALLEAEKVDCSVQAAAAQALGAIIKDEYMAADAIPILVKMMCSNVTQVSPPPLRVVGPGNWGSVQRNCFKGKHLLRICRP
jgi:hypothetical protein